MLFQRFANFVLSHRRNALLLALLFSAIPLMDWVSVVIIALVTLRLGENEGLLVLAVTAIPALILMAMGYPEHFYYHFLGSHVVCFVLACTLRESNSWALTLKVAVLIAIVVITAIHFIVPDLPNYWVKIFEEYYREAKDALAIKLGVENLTPVFQLWGTFATGLQVAGTLFIIITNLVLARWLQALLFNPGGLVQELTNVRLDYISVLLLLVVSILAITSFPSLRDYMPILLLLFFVAGLSLCHWIIIARQLWIWLFVYYAMLIFLFQFIAPFTVGLAIMDVFLNIRKRVNMV